MSDERDDEPDDWGDAWDDGDDRLCHFCGGEGWWECDDPLECTQQHRRYVCDDGVVEMCRCTSCGGSGLAKDMTIW